jgi:hypothetical protein
MQALGHRHFARAGTDEHAVIGLLGRLLALQSPGARDPHVRLGHGADRPALDKLDHAAVVLGRVDLDAHLRDDAGLRRGLAYQPRLVDVMGERLLAVDVLARLEREQRGERVGVFAGADDHGVKRLRSVEELPEVDFAPGLGVRRRGGREVLLVHVAERDDVLR